MSIQDDYFDILIALSKEDKKIFKHFAEWAFDMEQQLGETLRQKKNLETTIKVLMDYTCPAITIGYKLLRQRKNGSLGSLFINRKEILPFNHWIIAEPHRTKGFAFRPGFHVLQKANAPHLSKKNRVWTRVAITDYTKQRRPESQGGCWLLAQKMIILEIL